MSGRFDFFNMTLGGMPYGESVSVKTDTGLILQSHPKVDPDHVKHMAAIARETPNYPVDISLWEGVKGDRRMTWTARIYWRDQ